jgi:hypothetical protein
MPRKEKFSEDNRLGKNWVNTRHSVLLRHLNRGHRRYQELLKLFRFHI